MEWIKKRKILTVVIAIVVLGVIGSLAGGTDTSTTDTQANTEEPAQEQKQEEQVAGVGTAVRDGKFEFVVNSLTCGEKEVGVDFSKSQAQGVYCRLNIGVTNIGDEPQTLSSSDQKLIDAENKRYSSDDTATIYASTDQTGSTWLTDINPGNGVTGDIVFDVPEGTNVVKAELHDSAFSNGVTVKLN